MKKMKTGAIHAGIISKINFSNSMLNRKKGGVKTLAHLSAQTIMEQKQGNLLFPVPLSPTDDYSHSE